MCLWANLPLQGVVCGAFRGSGILSFARPWFAGWDRMQPGVDFLGSQRGDGVARWGVPV
jgi:hypothetical protein